MRREAQNRNFQGGIPMILVTGAGGMVGSHLLENLGSNNEMVGLYYRPTTNLAEVVTKIPRLRLVECDVRYYKSVLESINKYRPRQIYHLAAQSYPTVSWERPQDTMEINANGTINVFEAIKYLRENGVPDYDPVVVVACSSAEYGDSLQNSNGPVAESAALLPLHPYGVSKVVQDLLSYQYYKNFEIKCVRARIFNTTGPRKVDDVCSDFTKRAVLIEKGLTMNAELPVGNIETLRAITDVRDLVAALILLAEKGRWGEAYNISGAKVYKIARILEIIRENLAVNFTTKVEQSLLRPTDEKIIYGDSAKLIQDTGWTPRYSLEQTVQDMLEYWREKIC
jgi:GDP-4-dehydro-6-deoxy-D-mannose reductase